MTDRYEKIRRALAMGPTPGPWHWIGDSLTHRQFNIYAINGTDKHIATVNDLPVEKLWARDQVESEATAKLIAACDPDTIQELLSERDALREALYRIRANRADAHGWLFNNPDTGIEWSDQHPIESGEVPDAENVRPASAEEVVTLLREAWNALASERAAHAETRRALVEDEK